MARTSLILLTLALLFAVAVFAKPECGGLSLDYDDYDDDNSGPDDENSGPDDRTRSVRSGGNSSSGGGGGGGGSDSPTTATGTSTPTTPPGVLPAPTPGTL